MGEPFFEKIRALYDVLNVGSVGTRSKQLEYKKQRRPVPCIYAAGEDGRSRSAKLTLKWEHAAVKSHRWGQESAGWSKKLPTRLNGSEIPQ